MDPKRLEKKMTTGFKLFTGFYAGAISRMEISRLPEKEELHIPWNSREIDNALNAVGKQIMAEDLFKYWDSWDMPMIEIMSDAIAINFLLMMAKDWQRKGKPENKSSLEHKKLRKNAVILLDKSVYEYVTKKWRGSSDSRIATNLKTMSAMPDLFEPIPHEAWNKLIEEVIEEGKIEAVFYATGSDKRIKLLLCYYYCIECIGGRSPTHSMQERTLIILSQRLNSNLRPEPISDLTHTTS